ncbi:protein Tube [Drosophila simulans]|uniref:protein Tube n=1 Tax=Drosophila simulans TaxID=7240 RepID=UPI00078AF20A|nr:protein Tube [Drosophila simulans]KMZ01430.1 tub [Drosophila simulans]
MAYGWNGCGMGVQVNGSNGAIGLSSKYSRNTELRRVEDNDIYRLAKILDENSCWRKLMSIIPKGMDVQACSGAGCLNFPAEIKKGFKYTAQDVFQIDEAANRLPPDQSKSQMMIDEWKTSGKLNERPTVGVLLQLLVQAELFSAADFVALDFLNESTPARPVDGPGALISLELLEEEMEVDNEGLSLKYQPSTATLGAAAQGSVGLNLDNFEKDIVRQDKSVPQPSGNTPPIAPPRRQPRSATNSNFATLTGTGTTSTTIPNVPNLTILNPSEQIQEPVLQPRPLNIPDLSILIANSGDLGATVSDNPSNRTSSTDPPNIPRITLLIENSGDVSSRPNHAPAKAPTATTSTVCSNNLPMISALNISKDSRETLRPESRSSSSSLSKDDDDDNDGEEDGEEEYPDAFLPNLSNSEQQNSNNDSSLTTVTGTSGDNSFELTNDSSSTSNDDYACNIPDLSELQQ